MTFRIQKTCAASGRPEYRLLVHNVARYLREGVMSIQSASRLFGLLALIVPLTCTVATAQSSRVPVPVHGVTGTLALPDSVDKFYSDVNKIIIKTSEGISHVVPDRPGTTRGRQSLESLHPGTPVVVRYTVKGISASTDDIDRVGADGLNNNQGIVTNV